MNLEKNDVIKISYNQIYQGRGCKSLCPGVNRVNDKIGILPFPGYIWGKGRF